MRYEIDFDEHLMVLNPEEADFFLEPYQPFDGMPLRLMITHHRYIREFIYEWLVENFGSVESRAWTLVQTGNEEFFRFRNPDHAMLFKVVWDGQASLGSTTS
ncbi:MAG: hypothetical protein EOP83_15840 [Verrucomicrobiaceae bacterium]|nr:MAG: hypothetical protein EOP83_15840 [Verrucomicrobiaceae bacterium]